MIRPAPTRPREGVVSAVRDFLTDGAPAGDVALPLGIAAVLGAVAAMNRSHADPGDAVRVAEVAVPSVAAALAAMRLAFASLASGGTAGVREALGLARARVEGKQAASERLRADLDILSGHAPDEPSHGPRP